MSRPDSGTGGGTSGSSTVDPLGNVCANPPFFVSDYSCNHGASLDSRSFAAMYMTDDSATVWDVLFRR